MNDTLTIHMFDQYAARLARDAAVKQVGDNTSTWWMRRARAAIEKCAQTKPEFTTDDVWEIVGLDGSFDRRAMGAAMTAAHKAGVIERTDRTRNSAMPQNHGRPMRIWRRA